MKIELEIPEGKEAKWINDVLTLVDKTTTSDSEKPKHIYKVGDQVRFILDMTNAHTITELCYGGAEYDDTTPTYVLDSSIYNIVVDETEIEPYIDKGDKLKVGDAVKIVNYL